MRIISRQRDKKRARAVNPTTLDMRPDFSQLTQEAKLHRSQEEVSAVDKPENAQPKHETPQPKEHKEPKLIKQVRAAEKIKKAKQPRFQRKYKYRKGSAFVKNALRSISGHMGRFLAVFAIIALGAGVYAGLRMFVPDMYESADVFYDQNRMIDFRITSTLGLTDDDVEAIRETPGVKGATGIHMVELATTSGDQSFQVSVEGINMQRARDYQAALDKAKADGTPVEEVEKNFDPNYMNHIVVSEGRLPERSDEIVISNSRRNISLGQELTVKTVIGFDAPEDFLAVQKFKVVGFGTSPEFISDSYGISPQSGTTITNYGYVDNSAFKDPNIYTDVFVTAKGAEEQVAFSEGYKDAVEPTRLAIKELAPKREEIRREAILGDAQQEIDDGQKELDDAKAEADEKIADAEKTLADAKQKLEDGKQDLANGRQKLADGRIKYQDGVEELAKKRKEVAEEIAKGESDLRQAKRELFEGGKKYEQARDALPGLESKLAEAEAGLDKINDGLSALSQLDSLRSQLSDLQAQKASLEQQLSEANAGISQINASLAALTGSDPETQARRKALEDQRDALEASIPQIEAGISSVESGISQVSAGISQIEGMGLSKDALLAQKETAQAGISQLKDTISQVKAGMAKYKEGEAQYDVGEYRLQKAKEEAEAEFAKAEAELAQAKADLEQGERDIKKGEQDLIDGQQKVEDGEKELADKKEEARVEIAKNQKKLDDAREKLEDIPDAVWYILTRTGNPGYATYKANADRMDQITTIFPIFFFLVAALVSLITMTRMVESERIEIGTMKALGYTREKIATKYVAFALLASVFGSIFGIAVGVYVLPKVIWMSYSSMYTSFPFLIGFHWKDSLIAGALSVGVTLLATASAARLTLREAPTTLMLPRAPKPGKRIFLERITPLWKRMKFTSKVTARNLFRYKKRLIMTVLGVAGCTALLLTGFGIRDALQDFVPNHYYQINKFNETIGIDTKLDKEGAKASKDSLVAQAMDKYAVGEWEFFSNTAGIAENPDGDPNGIPFNVGGEEGRTGGSVAAELRAAKSDAPADASEEHRPGVLRDVTITIPHEGKFGDKTLETFYNLTDPKTGKPVGIVPGEALITQKLAENLQVKPGDTIYLSLDADKPSHPITVSGIAHYYIGHLVFIDANTYQKLFGEAPEYNVILGKGPADKTERTQIAEKLKESPAVSSVTFPEDLSTTYKDLTSSLGMLVALIIFVSGSLALIVLFNLTNINVEERRSEIATIKVLGFFDKEVDAYVFRETLFLSIMGTILGLPLGVLLCTFIMRSAELDDVMFVRNIEPMSYVLAVVITLVFTFIVMGLMHRKLKNIDMVSSLKAVD